MCNATHNRSMTGSEINNHHIMIYGYNNAYSFTQVTLKDSNDASCSVLAKTPNTVNAVVTLSKPTLVGHIHLKKKKKNLLRPQSQNLYLMADRVIPRHIN